MNALGHFIRGRAEHCFRDLGELHAADNGTKCFHGVGSVLQNLSAEPDNFRVHGFL